MARRWAPHEIDPTTFRSSVLISKERQATSIREHSFNGRRTSRFGEYELSARLSESFDQVVKKRIVQVSGDRISGHTQEGENVTAKLKVAEMATENNQRASRNHQPDDFSLLR